MLQQGATLVNTVNGILDQIASLNGQIRALTAVAMLNAIDNDHPKIARFVSHIQRW